MDDTPIRKRPWFYIVAWLVILLVVYAWQISRMGGFVISEVDIFIDLVCVFPIFLVFWLVFFAQFVLPVHTFRDRQKIFDRLITYIFGGHGPAMFVRNGQLIKREGEERQKGPGVLWLDSASAAVTRTATAIKQTMGPGVHFIENKEFVAGTVDLHIQTHSIGPKEADKPFEKQNDESDDASKQVQDRRKMVSALTRDGIEVVPNISVTFRVATGFPKEGQPGSRFGFRTGIAKRDRENEKQDQDAIRKAILGEGINPNERPESPRHRVAWNQLPAVLAVDVWREYVAKFTLDELFKPEQVTPSLPTQPSPPPDEDVDPFSQPVNVGRERESIQSAIASALRFLNVRMDKVIKWLEKKDDGADKKSAAPHPSTAIVPSVTKPEPKKVTALQVITEMVKARLTLPAVPDLNDTGQLHGGEPLTSREYQLLQDRGLKVINVSISNPRFSSTVEDSIIRSWNASWLGNAKTESEQIDRHRNNIEKTAEEKAKRQYAESLSREINNLAKTGKSDIKTTLKTLVLHSHSLIRSREQLRRRMITESQDIEAMIKWIEANGK